jgi:hypothetical protein
MLQVDHENSFMWEQTSTQYLAGVFLVSDTGHWTLNPFRALNLIVVRTYGNVERLLIMQFSAAAI